MAIADQHLNATALGGEVARKVGPGFVVQGVVGAVSMVVRNHRVAGGG